MKKLLTLFTMLLLCIASTWAQDYYIPVRRVTSFDPNKSYMLYNTAINGTEDRTGFIYVNDGNAMKKYVGTRRNPKQFMTTSTAYLWLVTTGSDNHVALQNESNKKYYGQHLGDNSGNPGNLYLYPWGTLTAKQSGVKSQNEDDPTQSTASSAVTFADNKVFVIGGASNGTVFWNGNWDNIGEWTDGHPFAFYEVETIDLTGYNVYTGASTTLNQSGWQTQSNWSLNDTWNSNNKGPGYTSSNMWSPIFLNGVTATGISLEGWNLCIKLVNSSLTATTNKFQTGASSSSVTKFDVDRTSALDLTMSGTNGDPGLHTFNIDGSLTIKTKANHFSGSSTNIVNLGTTGSFTFKADAAVTIGNNAPFTLNATPVDPSAENTPESRTLATFTNVTVSSLNVNIDGTGGWRQVASQEALQEQPVNGKYYYVGNDVDNASTYVKLYTFLEASKSGYTVTSDATLRQIIDSYGNFDFFSVDPGVTLTVDVENFDLTRITGEGNVVLAASTSLTGSRSTAATGKLTVNSGVTLTIDGGDSQTNYVSSFTSIDLLGTLEANTIAGSGNLTGTGTLRLLTFPTTSSVPTLTDWTGTVEFPADATDKGAIDEILNAWGNENSKIILKSVGTTGSKGQGQGTYFNGSKTITPAVEIAEGATVYLNNGNSNTKGIFTTLSGAGTLSLQWTGSYDQQINNLTDFTGTLDAGTNSRTITVDKLVLASAPSVDARLFKASGNVTLASLYVGETDQTPAYAWAVSTKEGVSGMYVTASAQQNITDAITLANTYFSQRLMGTGTGKYAVYIGETGYTDFSKFGTAVTAMTTLAAWEGNDVIAVINQPTSGYYRILNKGTQRYVNCTKVDDEATHTSAGITGDDAAKTIFYIDEDKNIQAYDNGAYWKGVFRMGRGTFDGGTFGKLTYKHPWQFIEGNTLGTYKLIYGNDTEGKYHATGSGNATSYAELNSDAANADAATWTLVAVTELPDRTDAGSTERGNEITYAPAGTTVPATVPNVLVTTAENTYQCNNLQLTDDLISEFGSGTTTSFTGTNVTYNRETSANQWGTICLPYAVSTDGDVAYYRLVAPVGDQTLRFERVTDATTTAYEPYLIKKAANAGLTIGASGAEFELGNPEPQDRGAHNGFVLKGIMVNTSVIDGNKYDVAKNEDYVAVTDPDAYYFEASSNTFRALNGRFNLKAFRAYLSTTDDSSSARSILGIDISEDGQATGISFVESEDGKTVDVVFDLNGRRLQEARKGINIINGKKVIK